MGLALLSMSVVLSASPAGAQPSVAPPLESRTDSDKDRAGLALDRGDALMAQGSYSEALVAYQEGDGIMSVPTTRLPIAVVLARLGRLVQAQEVALEVTRMPLEASAPAAFARAQAAAHQLASQLEARIPTLLIRVTGLSDGVVPDVQVDDMHLPSASLSRPLRLDPGRYRLTAVAPGYLQATAIVTLGEGKGESLTLAMQPAQPTATDSGVRAGQPTNTGKTAGASSVPTLAYVGFGVGAVGLVAGGVTGWLAFSKSGALEDECGGKVCPTRYESDLDSARRMGWVSNVSFGVAVVGTAVGVAALLSDEGSSQSDRAGVRVGHPRGRTVSPSVGLGHVGLSGQF
jgi:hypothetical protein